MLAETRAIHNGEFDDYLDEFRQAIEARKRAINYFDHEKSRLTIDDLNSGDTIKFSAQIRPKYLIGRTAEVVKTNRKTVTIKCPDDPGYGRFQGLPNVRCPLYLIEGLV